MIIKFKTGHPNAVVVAKFDGVWQCRAWRADKNGYVSISVASNAVKVQTKALV